MEKGKKELRSRVRQPELMRAQSLPRIRAYSSHFVPIIFPQAPRFRLIQANPAKSDLKKYIFFCATPRPPVKNKFTKRTHFQKFATRSLQSIYNKIAFPPRQKRTHFTAFSAPGRSAQLGRLLGRRADAPTVILPLDFPGYITIVQPARTLRVQVFI